MNVVEGSKTLKKWNKYKKLNSKWKKNMKNGKCKEEHISSET